MYTVQGLKAEDKNVVIAYGTHLSIFEIKFVNHLLEISLKIILNSFFLSP